MADPAQGTTLPEVGSFYVHSWGYDQTNVDFYRVVGHTAKCIKVQRWSKSVAAADQPCAYATPNVEAGPVMVDVWNDDYTKTTRQPAQVLLKRPDRNGWIRINSYSHAGPWDGTPRYQTGFGWGH